MKNQSFLHLLLYVVNTEVIGSNVSDAFTFQLNYLESTVNLNKETCFGILLNHHGKY